MAIQKTTDGKGGVSITDAYIKRRLIVIDDSGNINISVRLYKDQATHDADPENFNDEVSHPVTGDELTAMLAAIEGLADSFLKTIVYPGAVDV